MLESQKEKHKDTLGLDIISMKDFVQSGQAGAIPL